MFNNPRVRPNKIPTVPFVAEGASAEDAKKVTETLPPTEVATTIRDILKKYGYGITPKIEIRGNGTIMDITSNIAAAGISISFVITPLTPAAVTATTTETTTETKKG